MSHLIPEIRADINGKLVTRHVRTDSPEQALKDFPAPALGSIAIPEKSDDFKVVKGMLTNVLEHYLVLAAGGGEKDNYEEEEDSAAPSRGEADEDDYEDEDAIDILGWEPNDLLPATSIEGALDRLPERVTSQMRAKIDRTPYSDDYEIAVLHALTYESDSAQLIEYMTCLYDKISGFYPDRDVFGHPDVNTYTLMRDYMQGLRNYESVGYTLPENIYEATEEELSLMDSLHYLNTEIGDDEGNTEPELGKIVIDYPDSVQEVIDIVKERDTREAELVRAILNSQTPSMRSGLL